MKKENYEFGQYLTQDVGSRWADPEEIKNAHTLAEIHIESDHYNGSGIPIISDGQTAYVDSSDTHTMIFGTTGSKKTRLFAMPLINIFAMAGESFIATDPKGELYNKTSGLVAIRGYEIIVLNFRDLTQSDFWNPLLLPYYLYHSGKTDEAISLINDFINSLADPQRKNTKDIYFIELACSQMLANMLFFIETASPEQVNIINFANFFLARSTPAETEEMLKYVAEGSIAAINYKNILTNKHAQSTFGNVASCVSNMLSPFIIRKSLCQVLSTSSFDIRNIGKTKMAVYIIVPDEKTTLHFLITTFIKQTYEILINEAQQHFTKKLPIRLNFLLDEFCNIPAIPDMPSMISAARSRNMRFFLIAQSMRQLKNKYKEDADTIKGNCENWVFLTSREYELLEEISKLCGQVMYTDSDASRKLKSLVTISELQRLNKEKGEALILHGRNYPFVTELPDIDQYKFIKCMARPLIRRQLPSIVLYDAAIIINQIKTQQRPLLFSVEVFGKKIFYTPPIEKK
jgi:type IV secretion system protein VirD4